MSGNIRLGELLEKFVIRPSYPFLTSTKSTGLYSDMLTIRVYRAPLSKIVLLYVGNLLQEYYSE